MKRKFLFGIVACLLFSACYYDNSQELYGKTTCNTLNVTYTNTISNIINRYACLGCHTGVAPAGGFRLQTFDDVKAKAHELRNGIPVLLGALQHLPNFTPMPQNLSQISQCDINAIQAWINASTPQ